MILGRCYDLTHRGQIRPVADEVADIARRLQRAKHSLQDISEITGLERGWAVSRQEVVDIYISNCLKDLKDGKGQSF